jgi:hypothetical protein
MKYREILMEPWGFSSRQCGIPPIPNSVGDVVLDIHDISDVRECLG